MIEIVFLACSILHGAACKEEKLSFMAERVSMFECFLYGQTEMAKWVEGHPNWSVNRWRCQSARIEAKA